ncbi:MAG: hypothetical protein ACQ5SW_06570 [Sphaerochaetaceae bacterium]
MKRWILAGMLVVLPLCLLEAFPLDFASSSAWGMGNAGLALDYEADSFVANPALLALPGRRETHLLAALRYKDYVEPSYLENQEPNPLLVEPVTDLTISFSAGSLAFSVQNRNSLTDREVVSGQSRYDGHMTTMFQFDWATGRAPFYFGVSVRATVESERSMIEIRDDNAVLDYLVETTIGRYEPLNNSSNVAFGMGLLLDYHWFKMGVVSNQFAYARADDSLIISGDLVLRTLDWGFSVSSPTYDSSNQLHLFKVQGALDLLNLGSDENRQLRLGVSAKLQLLPTWSVSLQVGYREKKPSPGDLLGLSFSRGLQTISLDVQLDTFKVSFGYGYPTAWYVDSSAQEKPRFLASLALRL